MTGQNRTDPFDIASESVWALMSEQPDWSDEDEAISDRVLDALAVQWAAERAAHPLYEPLEEIPWTAENEAGTDVMWERLSVCWAREAEAAAAAKRRRERRRRRACGWKRDRD
jgi:hypothetical protein